MKKNFRRKAIALLIAALMLGSLAGCGGGESTEPENGEGNQPAASSETIKLGLNMELSGDSASYGSNSRDGAMLAINELNAAGGVLGMQIEPIEKDNKSDSAEAATLAAALIDEGVSAHIGPLTSGCVNACVPILEGAGIPTVAPAATAANITVNPDTNEVKPYAFRVCFIDPFQGDLMAEFALEQGYKTAAIYKDTSSDYSQGISAHFAKTFEAGGGTIVAEEGFTTGDRDFRATLNKINATNPEFLYIPGYYPEVAPLIKQAREAGMNMPMGGGDGWDSPDMLAVAGSEALNNCFFSNHYSPEDTDEKVVTFVTDYKATYNDKTPDAFAALGYDAVMAVAHAIETSGSTEPQAITDALASLSDFAGVTGNMTMDEFHNPIKAGIILEFVDGAQVMKTRIEAQ